jgi:hypothetical protein
VLHMLFSTAVVCSSWTRRSVRGRKCDTEITRQGNSPWYKHICVSQRQPSECKGLTHVVVVRLLKKSKLNRNQSGAFIYNAQCAQIAVSTIWKCIKCGISDVRRRSIKRDVRECKHRWGATTPDGVQRKPEGLWCEQRTTFWLEGLHTYEYDAQS